MTGLSKEKFVVSHKKMLEKSFNDLRKKGWFARHSFLDNPGKAWLNLEENGRANKCVFYTLYDANTAFKIPQTKFGPGMPSFLENPLEIHYNGNISEIMQVLKKNGLEVEIENNKLYIVP